MRRMGNEGTLAKTVQLDRDLANEFRSVRQFLNGSKESIPSDNVELQRRVVNRAIEYAFEQDVALRALGELTTMDRKNGTSKVSIEITKDNWIRLVQLLLKLDEEDFVQLCLRRYIDVVKVKRCLP